MHIVEGFDHMPLGHSENKKGNGVAGVLLPNISMSSTRGGEGDIRRAMVEAGVVGCMVALPGQIFYPMQIPSCLWVLSKEGKSGKDGRARSGELLFIDARRLGHMESRTRRAFSEEDISQIVDTYRAWRSAPAAPAYADVPGFCKSATLDDVRAHGHLLTPGRYVGSLPVPEDGEPFADKMHRMTATLRAQQEESAGLDAAIVDNIQSMGLWREK